MKRLGDLDLVEGLPRPRPLEESPSEFRKQKRKKKRSRKTRAVQRLELAAAGQLPRATPLPSRHTLGWWPYMLNRVVEDLQEAVKPFDRKNSTKEQFITWVRTHDALIHRALLNAKQLRRTLAQEHS